LPGQDTTTGTEHIRSLTGQRRSPRAHVRMPLRAAWRENGREHTEEVFTLTISKFGCAVLSETFFRLGCLVQLRNERENKVVDAHVVYCIQDYETRIVEVGMEFEEDDANFWEIFSLESPI